MEFAILGPLDVTHEGRPVALPGGRERSVLGLLLLSANKVVPAEHLVEDLWNGDPPGEAVAALRVFVSRLRKALREAGEDDVVLTRPPGYLVKVDKSFLDATRFEALLAHARTQSAHNDPHGAANTLREALALWRGPVLVDMPDLPRARAEAVRLEEARLAALEERVEADLACGRHAEVVPELDALTAAHPLRERLWGHRMVALYRSGRQADALRVYQELRTLLRDELGLQPSTEVSRLETAILNHARELEAPCRTAGPERIDRFRLAGPVPQPTPPDSQGHRRHNLPLHLTPFVGRVAELRELDSLLADARLVSLIGAGGAGKTRLAVHVAADAAERHPDGVWLVELAPVRDEALIGAAVAAAVGFDTTGLASAEALRRGVVTHLSSRRALLLFDNCEHLVDSVAHLVHDLLSNCPGIVVMATSREILELPGEVAWRVPPMSLPTVSSLDSAGLADSDAATLFLERVRTARPNFTVTPAKAAYVAQICHRLDGMPLALELAAARVPVLGVQQVAERLDRCFSLLTGGPRTAVPRHQTLRATLDWSHELLNPAERRALCRLAVFPAGFALDAAEAVLLEEPGNAPPTRSDTDVVDLLGGLVNKSLVVISDQDDAPPRYRLLEPVRQYAREKLIEIGEEAAAQRRHRDFCLSLIASRGNTMFLHEQASRVSADAESFLAALEWSWAEENIEPALFLVNALWVHWFFGSQTGAREWLERVLARSRHIDHPVRVDALLGLAMLHPSDPTRRQTLLKEATALANRIDDPHSHATLAFVAGAAAARSGSTADARHSLEEALAIYQRSGYARGEGYCHDQLGWVAIRESDQTEASVHFARAAKLARQDDSAWLAAQALSALAPLRVLGGDADEGLRLARDAISEAEQVRFRLVLVMALVRAAETALLAAEPGHTVGFLLDALWQLSALGTQRYLGDCLELAALTLLSRAEHEAAATMFAAAASSHDAVGGVSGVQFIAERAQLDRDSLAEILGAGAYARQRSAGEGLSQQQAIQLARDYLRRR